MLKQDIKSSFWLFVANVLGFVNSKTNLVNTQMSGNST